VAGLFDDDLPPGPKKSVPSTGQFDPREAFEKRDEALGRVEAHAAPEFMDLALGAIERVARQRDYFIVDEVWAELDGSAPTHEKRAMGAAMRVAASRGLIEPTPDFRASEQPQCHANPRRIWRSRLK
jgi:hypothetical protein